MSWFGSWAGDSQAKLPAGSQSSIAAPSKDGFKAGEVVEYHSSSQGKWIPAKVLKVNPHGTYDLDCKPDVPLDKLRAYTGPPLGSSVLANAEYRVGDVVEYFGATQARWVAAKVLVVNANGTFDLDCKPGVMPEKMRRPASMGSAGSLYSPGEIVDYFSASQGKWIPAKVLSANPSGTYDLDCKPDVQADKIRRQGSDKSRPVGSTTNLQTYQAGDVVEYFGATLGKWIPAKVLKSNPDGTFDLDCKPSVQTEKMRRPTTLPPDAGAGPANNLPYRPGDVVSYYSASLNKWIPAKVVSANAKGTYDLDCKPDVPPDKIRPLGAQPVGTGTFGSGPLNSTSTVGARNSFVVGDQVEYFGTTLNKFIPAKVLKVNPDGTYDLDCKPGVLPEKVRPRSSPAATPADSGEVYSVGERVEYFGATQQMWIPAKVLSVNANGTYSLDCKPDVPTSRIRRPGGALGSAASLASSAGESVQGNPLRHVSFGGDTKQGLFTSSASRAPATISSEATAKVEAVQLLRVRRGGAGWHFEVCPEGAAMLERHGQRRLAVASMCGLHRSGKSFLVNLLLGRAQQGLPILQVGSGARGGTDGLWLWGPADDEDEKSPLLAFLDCEGFGRSEGDRARESHLITLCALLSSVVLLNSPGDINQELVTSLARVSRFVDNIEERGNEGYRPVLLWVLRDFVSDLKDASGTVLTPDEYLEQALLHNEKIEQDQGHKQLTKEVRLGFLKFFRRRNCLTLAPPSSGAELQHLDRVQYSALKGDFRSGVEQLRQQVFGACYDNPKSVSGQPLGCFAFVQLLKQLVAALNDDRILNVRGAWETVQHTVCGQLADDLRGTATVMLRGLASGQKVPGGAQLPLTDEALYNVLRAQRHSLKSKWEENAVGTEAVRREYWQELKETLAREEALVRVQNGRLADQQLMEVLRTWQDWLDDEESTKGVTAEQICAQLGGAMEKLPAMSLSRAGRAALQAAARRVAVAHSTVAATMAQQGDLEKKAVEWGEQAAKQEGAARSELEAMKSELAESQEQVRTTEQAVTEVERETKARSAELQETKARLQEVLDEIEAAHSREHDLKAHQRVVAESQENMRVELEQCLATVAKLDAERLASDRCARTATQAAADEKERLEAELQEARAEAEHYRKKIEEERECLKGENEKTRAEHQEKVEEVRKQLEEERKLLEGEQEKTRSEHMRMVEDTRRQMEEERKAHTGTLDEHKGRLLERQRGAGILEGKLQVLTAENGALQQQLKELEEQVREAELRLEKQTQENDQKRADLAKARAETEEVEAEAAQKLRAQAKELEQWMEDELDHEERGAKPRCGCSIQ